MKKYINILLMLWMVFFHYQCDLVNSSEETDKKLIVNGLIFSNSPVIDFLVTEEMEPLSTDTTLHSVSGATITLQKSTEEVILQEYEDKPGYYYHESQSWIPKSGDIVQLNIKYGSQELTSEIIVPDDVKNLELNSKEFTIFQKDTVGYQVENYVVPSIFEARWQYERSYIYFAKLEVLDIFDIEIGLQDSIRKKFNKKHFWKKRQQNYFYEELDIFLAGTYRLYIASVDSSILNYPLDYQSSKSLPQMNGNINNGLGFFQGFGLKSVDFTVKKSES